MYITRKITAEKTVHRSLAGVCAYVQTTFYHECAVTKSLGSGDATSCLPYEIILLKSSLNLTHVTVMENCVFNFYFDTNINYVCYFWSLIMLQNILYPYHS